jgi:hypothetical protein
VLRTAEEDVATLVHTQEKVRTNYTKPLLTPRQYEVLDLVWRFIEQNDRPPT